METSELVGATKKVPPRNSQFVSSGPRHGLTLSEWSKNIMGYGVAAGAPSSTSPLARRSSGRESTRNTRRSLFERTGHMQPSSTTERMSLGGVSSDRLSNSRVG